MIVKMAFVEAFISPAGDVCGTSRVILSIEMIELFFYSMMMVNSCSILFSSLTNRQSVKGAKCTVALFLVTSLVPCRSLSIKHFPFVFVSVTNFYLGFCNFWKALPASLNLLEECAGQSKALTQFCRLDLTYLLWSSANAQCTKPMVCKEYCVILLGYFTYLKRPE